MRTKRIENAKETMKSVKSSGIRNTQKINATGINADDDGTATRKMIDNLGQVGAGVARVTGRTALGTAQSVAAAPGAIKKAIKQRKDDVDNQVSKRLGSRLGLRKDDPETKEKRREKRIERIGKLRAAARPGFEKKVAAKNEREAARQKVRDRIAAARDENKNRGDKMKNLSRTAKINQSKNRTAERRKAARTPKALPAGKKGGELATRPVQRINTDQNVPTPKALPAARETKGQLARRDPEEKKKKIEARGGSVTEQFLNEVENMKKEKVDKVIDIMRGKNKIEVNPKVNESHLLVQDLADYKPLEIETIDLIKPEPLKASNWRNEISEEDKKIISINKGKRLDAKKQAFKDMVDEPYETDDKKRKDYGKKLLDRLTKVDEGAAWTKKEGKNKSGGLNEKGRKSYERENPGSDLKAPSKKVGNPRRKSFCARMRGMKKKLTSKKTASDPNSRINKSLRAWNC